MLVKAGLCSLEPQSPQRAHRCVPSLRGCHCSPRGSAPGPWAYGPRRPYLRVGEIVEEEGRQLFVQQRAAVVPRHLPAAAAACGGINAEPARGRERASERAREGGESEAGGRWRAELGPGAAAGPLAAGAGPRGARAGRGSHPPPLRCAEPDGETRSRSPPQAADSLQPSGSAPA